MSLTVGSLFSGIGGIDLGFERAGMDVRWQCEADEKCIELLAARWPVVPVYDDVRTIRGDVERVDVLCGGFPCQDVSVAGSRAGLAGERSGLFHQFMRVAAALAPRWLVIENVPGLLSSGHKPGCVDPRCSCCDPGADMGTVLWCLAELGYGWAYRVLDAQYVGVAQRRRRVFIVGCAGDAAGAAAVLLEPESCGGNPPPRRPAPEVVAATLGSQPEGSGWRGDTDRMTFVPALARCVATRGGGRQEPSAETFIGTVGLGSYPLHADDLAQPITGRHGDPGVVAYSTKLHNTHSNQAGKFYEAFAENQRGEVLETDYARQITTGGGKPGQGYPAVRQGMAVRRLTPLECERLQGFPDGWTEGFSDATRYRMLGNAVAVPVAEWIGRRIEVAA